ncbi:Two component regulator three Y domain-containing protein [Listeria weihenstephanensis FSL R9-0317]|uniref:hypothetical protein n=1 Tax=Listeria weihenstephanensis TaxID=1006155 RepID=UPI0003E8576D|nr:hypothetical protein [Listeria weihenstephanensis]EUJ37134.1 Two component regulator three Y domain-containing protein [Listeria weihenstephanensis FSL R9-0317]
MKKWFISQSRKLYFGWIQRKKKMSNGTRLTYILNTVPQSDTLVIVLSSLALEGKSVYNHVRSLKDTPYNRLYVLDNFGYEKRGVFYLGEKNGMEVRDAVEELIGEICDSTAITKKIFTGSCKGGTAAIYLGLRLKASKIIVGAPMYYISDCLNMKLREYLIPMLDKRNPNGENELNQVIRETVHNVTFNGQMYVQYSSKDEYYPSQIRPLINDLEEQKISLVVEQADYLRHDHCSRYFSSFLKSVLADGIKLSS